MPFRRSTRNRTSDTRRRIDLDVVVRELERRGLVKGSTEHEQRGPAKGRVVQIGKTRLEYEALELSLVASNGTAPVS